MISNEPKKTSPNRIAQGPISILGIGLSGDKSPKKKKGKLTKDDIGLPTHFEHLAHAGWGPNQKVHTFGLTKSRSFENNLDLDPSVPGDLDSKLSRSQNPPSSSPFQDTSSTNSGHSQNNKPMQRKAKRTAPPPPIATFKAEPIPQAPLVATEQPFGTSFQPPTSNSSIGGENIGLPLPKPHITPRTKSPSRLTNQPATQTLQQPVHNAYGSNLMVDVAQSVSLVPPMISNDVKHTSSSSDSLNIMHL